MLRKLAIILLVSQFGCSKTGDVSQNSSPKPKPSDGWLTYEDDMFKAAYPPGSEVWGAKQGKQDPKYPNLGIVPPPYANKAATAGFILMPENVTQNMLLRDAIQSEISRFKTSSGVVVVPPREIPVGGGRCISAIVVTPSDNCPKNTGSCFAPLYLTQCDGPKGARFTASTVLSVGPQRDGLSSQAKSEAATYERILRSLVFKTS